MVKMISAGGETASGGVRTLAIQYTIHNSCQCHAQLVSCGICEKTPTPVRLRGGPHSHVSSPGIVFMPSTTVVIPRKPPPAQVERPAPSSHIVSSGPHSPGPTREGSADAAQSLGRKRRCQGIKPSASIEKKRGLEHQAARVGGPNHADEGAGAGAIEEGKQTVARTGDVGA